MDHASTLQTNLPVIHSETIVPTRELCGVYILYPYYTTRFQIFTWQVEYTINMLLTLLEWVDPFWVLAQGNKPTKNLYVNIQRN